MATLTVLKDGEKKDYNITQEQAEKLTAFKYDNSFTDDAEINGVKKSEMVAIIFDKKPVVPFYYTVRLSYNDAGQDITITAKELPNVYWAFIKDTKVVLDNGAFRGKDIISILPDYNKMLGFNKGYDLQSEDFALISRDQNCNDARNLLANVKNDAMSCGTFAELKYRTSRLLLN